MPVCFILAVLTVLRNSDWKDNYTLFSTDLKKASGNCELNYFVAKEIPQSTEADAAMQQRVSREKIDYLNRAIEIYPDFSEAHAALGAVYDRLQMPDSAIVHDLRAVALNDANSIATYNLARAYYIEKQYADAIVYFKKTISLEPELVIANLNLARCYTDFKEYDSAIAYFNKTLALDPSQQKASQGLAYANAMKSQGDTVKNNGSLLSN
jgi:tetratricopeptide (TPR) repeat protein